MPFDFNVYTCLVRSGKSIDVVLVGERLGIVISVETFDVVGNITVLIGITYLGNIR